MECGRGRLPIFVRSLHTYAHMCSCTCHTHRLKGDRQRHAHNYTQTHQLHMYEKNNVDKQKILEETEEEEIT